MEPYVFLFVNTALVMGCIAMAVVFLLLPLPQNLGLRKYRISLRLLAGAYLCLAILKILLMIFTPDAVNLIGIEILIIASLQAPLFTFSLITLINPTFITRRYLYKQLMPVPFFTILYIVIAANWGNPQILTFGELKQLALHPAVLVREAFLIYYIFQLLYLIRLFYRQARRYKKEIDNYFADNASLHLTWVRYCFNAALTVGILAFLSCFLFTIQLIFIFSIAYAIFYLVFGLYYIQYPATFMYLEQSIFSKATGTDEMLKNNKRLAWCDLKIQIIRDKYYLKTGVNIEDMAHFLKIGRTSLSTFINLEESMNFNAWINSLRIEEAKILLLQYPHFSLTQIAEMVGYTESSNFSRQFKLIINECPSVWRLSNQDNKLL